MNTQQKTVLIATILVVFAMLAFPPFQAVNSNGVVLNMGYAWIMDPPRRGYMPANVDVAMLVTQWIGVLIIGILSFFFVTNSTRRSRTIVSTTEAKNTAKQRTDTHELSTESVSQDSTSAKKPTGVGGWLLLLIVGMMVLGPLLGAGRIAGEFISAETQHPELLSIDQWSTYKTASWLVYLVIALISFYGGWGLAFLRDWSAVLRAKVILWISGPLGSIVLAFIVPGMIFEDFGSAEAGVFGPLVGSIIAASIWTAYLSYSKRVTNTYGDPLNRVRATLSFGELNWQNILAWIVSLFVGFLVFFVLFGQDWIDFSSGLLDTEPDSHSARLLGFALTANLLPCAIWLVSKFSSRIVQTWPFNSILPFSSPVLKILLALSAVQWLLEAVSVSFRFAA